MGTRVRWPESAWPVLLLVSLTLAVSSLFLEAPLALGCGLLAAEVGVAAILVERRHNLSALLVPAAIPALGFCLLAGWIADLEIRRAERTLREVALEGKASSPSIQRVLFDGALRLQAGELSETGQRELLQAARDAQGEPFFRFELQGRRMVAAHVVTADGGHGFAFLWEWWAVAPAAPQLTLLAFLLLGSGFGALSLIRRYRTTILGPLETTRRANLARLESRMEQTQRQLDRALEERGFLSGELRTALGTVEETVKDRTVELERGRRVAEDSNGPKAPSSPP